MKQLTLTTLFPLKRKYPNVEQKALPAKRLEKTELKNNSDEDGKDSLIETSIVEKTNSTISTVEQKKFQNPSQEEFKCVKKESKEDRIDILKTVINSFTPSNQLYQSKGSLVMNINKKILPSINKTLSTKERLMNRVKEERLKKEALIKNSIEDENVKKLFPLPKILEDLLQRFIAIDQILRIEKQKNSKLTFVKAKTFVENLTKLNLEKKHLGQISSLFPTGYQYECVPDKDAMAKRRGTAQHSDDFWRLNITADLKMKREDGSYDLISPITIQNRKQNFYHILLAFLLKKHDEFAIQKEGISKWNLYVKGCKRLGDNHPKHPLFNASDVIQEASLDIADIPEPPKRDFMEMLSAKKTMLQYEDKKIWATRINEKIYNKLELNIFNCKNNQTQINQEEQNFNPKEESILLKPLKVMSSFERLKEKVITKEMKEKLQQRELQKKVVENHGLSVQEIKRITLTQRLPRIVNIVYSISSMEKNDRWKLTDIIERVHHTYIPKLEKKTVLESFVLLVELVPFWINIFKNELGEFVRINNYESIEKTRASLNNEIERGLKRKYIAENVIKNMLA